MILLLGYRNYICDANPNSNLSDSLTSVYHELIFYHCMSAKQVNTENGNGLASLALKTDRTLWIHPPHH